MLLAPPPPPPPAIIEPFKPPPRFTIEDAAATEGGPPALITIRKDVRSDAPSVLSLQTFGATADPGADYTDTGITLTFGPLEMSQTIEVPLTNDLAVEHLEAFSARLVAVRNARFGDPDATITIADDDTATPPSVQLPVIPSNFDVASHLVAAEVPPEEPGSPGAFRFICSASHEAYDDPIIFPGQSGISHLHQFFGNTKTGASSTYESLRTTGESSCNNKLNRSAYWYPAMMNGHGKVVRPDFVSVYYKRWPQGDPNCDWTRHPTAQGRTCAKMPRGLRYVFDRIGKDGRPQGWFNCDGPGATGGHYADIVEAAPFCPVGTRLGAMLVAPDCWDGVNLDSADHRSHMAYAGYGSWGYLRCPDTHPIVIPQLQIGAWFAVDDDLDRSGVWEEGRPTWHLASDVVTGKPMAKPGTTWHADWFGGWDDPTLDAWTDNCIDKRLSCSSGVLGNGQQIKIFTPSGSYSYVATPRLVDPPVQRRRH